MLIDMMLTMSNNSLTLVIVFLNNKESVNQWWIKSTEIDWSLGSITSHCSGKEPALVHFPKTQEFHDILLLMQHLSRTSVLNPWFGEKKGDPRGKRRNIQNLISS